MQFTLYELITIKNHLDNSKQSYIDNGTLLDRTNDTSQKLIYVIGRVELAIEDYSFFKLKD